MELHVAAEAGFTEEVIAFISAGGDVNILNQSRGGMYICVVWGMGR